VQTSGVTTFRDEWLDAVRAEAKSPPDKVRAPVAVAVARAYFDHGDDDGTRIQAGCETVGRESMVSHTQVSRVRQWLLARDLAHQESAAVKGRKALWWHAALPDRHCRACSPVPPGERETASPVPPEVQETSPVPPPVPSPVPPRGTRPVTSNHMSNEEEKPPACVRETPYPTPYLPPWEPSGSGCSEWQGGRGRCGAPGAGTSLGAVFCAEHLAQRGLTR
jgi:hypothetical protein